MYKRQAEDGFVELCSGASNSGTTLSVEQRTSRLLESGTSSDMYNGDHGGVQDATQPATPVSAQATKKIDWVLVMLKCTVPALFVVLAAIIALPLNNWLSSDLIQSTEHVAGGALIVTYAFERAPSPTPFPCTSPRTHPPRAPRAPPLDPRRSDQVVSVERRGWQI